jgi:glycogen debranching enzyme
VRRNGAQRLATVRFDQPPLSGPAEAVWEVTVPPQGRWALCMELSVAVGEARVEPRHRCGEPVEHAEPRERLRAWRSRAPVVTSDHAPLVVATTQAVDDLGVLRIEDPDDPDRHVIAAGVPWFMTLFGRDSLLTSWMALLVDPDLALGVLQTLARFQGEEEHPETEEQPGRILHEVRFGEAAQLSLGGGSVYYGTADATQLFVMLLGELRRWGLADADVKALMPHADRAFEWIERYGDRDGDGYVEYQRATPRGLLHQGWKDSWDGVRFADGRHAEPPIALCEVQAYTYAAYVARAHFCEQEGDLDRARRWLARAQDLKARFNEDFWLEDRGWYAVGLDRDKRPIDTLTSNIGHCLWTGIIDEEKAPLVAERLLSPELFSGWGLRTLATSMAAYNPMSYHCGSVWPHDTALSVSGLMRYGFVEEAHRIVLGLLDVAAASGGRLPELFCGFARDDLSAPVGYPTSCSPQAWSAASPLLLTRALLRLDPWVPHDTVWLAPALPEPIRRLRVAGIPLAGGRATVTVEGDDVEVEGLPASVELRREPRRPLTGLYEELA